MSTLAFSYVDLERITFVDPCGAALTMVHRVSMFVAVINGVLHYGARKHLITE